MYTELKKTANNEALYSSLYEANPEGYRKNEVILLELKQLFEWRRDTHNSIPLYDMSDIFWSLLLHLSINRLLYNPREKKMSC